MRTPPRTLKELNEAQSLFWAKRDAMRKNPAVCETAVEAWLAQQKRAVPPQNRFSLEEAFDAAERTKQRFARQLASKGGAALKQDALKILIGSIVSIRRTISCKELHRALEERKHHSVVKDVDETNITFESHGGKLINAPISGLKDRLSRAKKKYNSR